MQIGTAAMGNRFLQELETELPYHSTIPLLGMHPKELNAGCQSDVCTPMFTAPLFTIAKM